MQLAVTTKRVPQSAFRFGERWRIENDQIVFGFGFLSPAQESENIMLDPAQLQSVPFRILLSSRDVLRILFDCGHVRAARPRAGEGKRALVCKTIEHPPSGREV